jgi:hypothetical protein
MKLQLDPRAETATQRCPDARPRQAVTHARGP